MGGGRGGRRRCDKRQAQGTGSVFKLTPDLTLIPEFTEREIVGIKT